MGTGSHVNFTVLSFVLLVGPFLLLGVTNKLPWVSLPTATRERLDGTPTLLMTTSATVLAYFIVFFKVSNTLLNKVPSASRGATYLAARLSTLYLVVAVPGTFSCLVDAIGHGHYQTMDLPLLLTNVTAQTVMGVSRDGSNTVTFLSSNWDLALSFVFLFVYFSLVANMLTECWYRLQEFRKEKVTFKRSPLFASKHKPGSVALCGGFWSTVCLCMYLALYTLPTNELLSDLAQVARLTPFLDVTCLLSLLHFTGFLAFYCDIAIEDTCVALPLRTLAQTLTLWIQVAPFNYVIAIAQRASTVTGYASLTIVEAIRRTEVACDIQKGCPTQRRMPFLAHWFDYVMTLLVFLHLTTYFYELLCMRLRRGAEMEEQEEGKGLKEDSGL